MPRRIFGNLQLKLGAGCKSQLWGIGVKLKLDCTFEAVRFQQPAYPELCGASNRYPPRLREFVFRLPAHSSRRAVR